MNIKIHEKAGGAATIFKILFKYIGYDPSSSFKIDPLSFKEAKVKKLAEFFRLHSEWNLFWGK
ncbi:hypothetical protein [Rossellomorea sp. SC111]|uniref:hypothetical protein n=1 Tax=Rossellomorea sp. SC111 TaxID=2968985 RepID=UPI00215AFBC9|nr:hypothetical protein [Rossellomorea sp. SC111]